MEKLNWKKILLLCLPIVFAVSLAITLAACMAQAGRGVEDSLFGDGNETTTDNIPVLADPEETYSEGLTYTSRGDGTCVLSGLGTCRDKEITVPRESPSGDKVTAIGTSAFLGSVTVERITLPDTLKSIGDYAFYGSVLKEILIPSGVESIGEGAFAGCRSLTAVSVDSANTRYSSIDGVLFSKDKSRIYCYPSGRKASSYTIRYGVSIIETAAFLDCVYLETVSFNGSESEWEKVKIGANNTSLTSLTVKFLTSVK